jgi:hypothetical protein
VMDIVGDETADDTEESAVNSDDSAVVEIR